MGCRLSNDELAAAPIDVNLREVAKKHRPADRDRPNIAMFQRWRRFVKLQMDGAKRQGYLATDAATEDTAVQHGGRKDRPPMAPSTCLTGRSWPGSRRPGLVRLTTQERKSKCYTPPQTFIAVSGKLSAGLPFR